MNTPRCEAKALNESQTPKKSLTQNIVTLADQTSGSTGIINA
jgi:hypothetical protein